MKISLNWLKDYILSGVSVDTLTHKLTMAGLEVESVQKKGNDTVLELEITPNRADCLSMVGMAREVAAVLEKKYEEPKASSLKMPKKKTDVTIEDKESCLKYIGTVIEGVEVKKAPLWMAKRLESIGVRSISNVVDITNFCLVEMGQPLHAFDYDKLEGGKIIVRRARKGEKIITLDDVERVLDPSILVIADAKKPVAIAGIMGGKNTEVTSTTKRILLESAHFDSVLIRRSSRKLGLSSDSSYRFERAVDLSGVKQASMRAIAILSKESNIVITEHNEVVVKAKEARAKIKISLDYIANFVGESIALNKCKKILNTLGFKLTKITKKDFIVEPPSFRRDVFSQVDVVEEITRVIGYDNLPMSMPRIKVNSMTDNINGLKKNKIRENLIGLGFSETITFSLINEELIHKTNEEHGLLVRVTNPLSKDQEVLRPTLLPNFLQVAATNINRGQKNLKLFELGKVYYSKGETSTLGMLISGESISDWRKNESSNFGFYDLKGAIEQLLDSINVKNVKFLPFSKEFFNSGVSAEIFISSKSVGYIGEVSKEVQKRFDIKVGQTYYAQLDIDKVLAHIKNGIGYQEISGHPSISRDISLAIKKDVPYQNIVDLALETGKGLLSNISFIEEYLGDKIEKDSRGLVFSLTYQAKSRTLTEQEVSEVHDKILKSIIAECGAIIR